MLINLGKTTLLAPLPVVMVSCRGTEGVYDKSNIFTAAWAGVVCTQPPCVSVSIRPSRFSYEQILQSGEFAVNLVNEPLLRSCDYCGVKSGRDIDKFAECKLDAATFEEMPRLPVIRSAPAALLCKVVSKTILGSHTQFIGEVTAVKVQDVLVDSSGRVCLERAELVAYSHGDYVSLGKKLGFFGYSVASEKALERRMR